jgi:predicted TIM-barrel fold metal-dependent hydrolase
MTKIDIYAHIIPPKYAEALEKLTSTSELSRNYIEWVPTLKDFERRFQIMDRYDEYVQILTVELAKIANNEIAELIYKYPERFVGGVATLPMDDMDACLKEVDRAINELNMRGVLLWTSVSSRPLDSPEYMPLYEKMSHYDLPIWIHPFRGRTTPDYSCEKESKYHIYSIFGWVYETTVAMSRLVFGQVLEKYPNLKFITHHCGAMVPYLAHRIVSMCDINEMRYKEKDTQGLTKHAITYFHRFYNDTALNGATPALACAFDFFGPEHLLFGTDTPFDSQIGNLTIGKTIRAIEQMDIPESDKKKIFEDNARRLLRLPA